jgi:hypothetical protein
MKQRIIIGLILLIFALVIFAQGISAAEKPRHRPPLLLSQDAALFGEETARPMAPVVLYEGSQPDCEDIHPTVGLERLIQHDQFGATVYDYQKNGSMGRMIAVGPGGHRYTVFHETRGPTSEGYPRYVTYNCKDPLDQWLGPTWIDGGEGINAGYTQMLVMHDGRPVVLYHRQGDPPWHSSLLLGDDGYTCSGDFGKMYDLPDVIDGYISAPNGYWPKGCIVYDAEVDTDYVHIICTESTGGTNEQTFAYQRCAFQGDVLVCHSPGFGPYIRHPNAAYPAPFETIAPVDTVRVISGIIVSSPVSDRVAIVYAKNRDNYYSQVNNDVVYIESMDNGEDWLDSSNWPAVRHNVSNYPTEATERVYTDVAACYDYNDSLHIVWSAAWYDSVNGLTSYDANLYHWSKESGITMIADAYWDGTHPNKWCRNIAKMSISALDPVYHPGGDPQ